MYIDQVIAAMQEDHKYLYMLESKVKLGWFLVDYGFDATTSLQLFEGIPTGRPSDSAAIWYNDRFQAVKFDSEESVEEFQTFFDRPSSIIRIELEEISDRDDPHLSVGDTNIIR